MNDVLENKSRQILMKTDVKLAKRDEKSQGCTWVMYFSAFTANFLLVTVGNGFVWTSSAIPKLTSNDTSINPFGEPISTLQVSIIASAPAFAIMLSLIPLAKLSDAIGRKKSFLLISIFMTCSLTSIAFATHIYIYYICFLINGIGTAGIFVNIPLYVNEIADDKSRTPLGCLVGFMISSGVMLGYIYDATFCSVKWYTLASAIPTLFYVLTSFLVVESPVYYANKKIKLHAFKVLEKIRKNKNSISIELEYSKIEDYIYRNKTKSATIKYIFVKRSWRKAFMLSGVLLCTQQLSGSSVIFNFMAPIFNEAGLALSGNTVGILASSLQVLVVVIVTLIVNKFGKRPLLLCSSLGCSITMFFIGIFFLIKQLDLPILKHILWLPVLCVLLFTVAFDFGLGPLSVAITGEVFRAEIRAVGIAIVMIIQSLVAFAVAFSFPLMSEAYGVHSSLFMHSAVTLASFFYLLFQLPETRGKSFKEIQELLEQ